MQLEGEISSSDGVLIRKQESGVGRVRASKERNRVLCETVEELRILPSQVFAKDFLLPGC